MIIGFYIINLSIKKLKMNTTNSPLQRGLGVCYNKNLFIF
jgi:hypothetical protein